MVWTRRDVMMLMGAAGSMASLDAATGTLAATDQSGSPRLPSVSRGLKVIVLGGGIAGLTAAFELERAGHSCTILEARGRLGGRNFTMRDASRVPHRDGVQIAHFAGDDYFNAGPARLPPFHRNVLAYCRRFGVALEPFVFQNHNAFVVDDRMMNGRALRHRRVNYSVAALAEEMALKASGPAGLDTALSSTEQQALKALLESRSLGSDRAQRAGFVRGPDASLDPPETETLLPARELIKAPDLGDALAAYDRVDWQATLMQPVGGMDRIVDGFARNVAAPVHLETEVVAIEQDEAGVRVATRDRRTGQTRAVEGDAAVVTLPLPVLEGLRLDASERFRRAVGRGATRYAASSKLAWPARRRFWEEDEGVYGGASILGGRPMQFWYPSSGFGSATGVLLGCYNSGENGEQWARMNRAEQVAASRAFGARMHAAFNREVGEPVAIDWIDQPFSRGAWAYLAGDMSEGSPYAVLRKREGRVVLAGDHLSQLTGWQEGAILSAYTAIEQLAELRKEDA